MSSRLALLVLALIAGLAVAIVWLLASGPPALTAIFGTGIGFLVTKLYDSWKESRTRLYDKKREIYSRLLAPWIRVFAAQIEKNLGAKEISTEDIIKEFAKDLPGATFDAMLYASDEVLQKYGRMRASSLGGGSAGPMVLVLFAQLIKAIRRDLGNTYSSVSEEDLLGLVVNWTDADRASFRAAVQASKLLAASPRVGA